MYVSRAGAGYHEGGGGRGGDGVPMVREMEGGGGGPWDSEEFSETITPEGKDGPVVSLRTDRQTDRRGDRNI